MVNVDVIIAVHRSKYYGTPCGLLASGPCHSNSRLFATPSRTNVFHPLACFSTRRLNTLFPRRLGPKTHFLLSEPSGGPGCPSDWFEPPVHLVFWSVQHGIQPHDHFARKILPRLFPHTVQISTRLHCRSSEISRWAEESRPCIPRFYRCFMGPRRGSSFPCGCRRLCASTVWGIRHTCHSRHAAETHHTKRIKKDSTASAEACLVRTCPLRSQKRGNVAFRLRDLISRVCWNHRRIMLKGLGCLA